MICMSMLLVESRRVVIHPDTPEGYHTHLQQKFNMDIMPFPSSQLPEASIIPILQMGHPSAKRI